MLLGRGLADSISSTQGPVLVSACPIAHNFSDPAPNSEDHAELDLEALHLMGGQHQERQQQYGLAASKLNNLDTDFMPWKTALCRWWKEAIQTLSVKFQLRKEQREERQQREFG
ncbi:hypothetical protein VPH35_029956 [Triticum aestivum]